MQYPMISYRDLETNLIQGGNIWITNMKWGENDIGEIFTWIEIDELIECKRLSVFYEVD